MSSIGAVQKDGGMADKGGFPHYMIKEIFEQPKSLYATITPRVAAEEDSVHLEDVHIK